MIKYFDRLLSLLIIIVAVVYIALLWQCRRQIQQIDQTLAECGAVLEGVERTYMKLLIY